MHAEHMILRYKITKYGHWNLACEKLIIGVLPENENVQTADMPNNYIQTYTWGSRIDFKIVIKIVAEACKAIAISQ